MQGRQNLSITKRKQSESDDDSDEGVNKRQHQLQQHQQRSFTQPTTTPSWQNTPLSFAGSHTLPTANTAFPLLPSFLASLTQQPQQPQQPQLQLLSQSPQQVQLPPEQDPSSQLLSQQQQELSRLQHQLSQLQQQLAVQQQQLSQQLLQSNLTATTPNQNLSSLQPLENSLLPLTSAIVVPSYFMPTAVPSAFSSAATSPPSAPHTRQPSISPSTTLAVAPASILPFLVPTNTDFMFPSLPPNINTTPTIPTTSTSTPLTTSKTTVPTPSAFTGPYSQPLTTSTSSPLTVPPPRSLNPLTTAPSADWADIRFPLSNSISLQYPHTDPITTESSIENYNRNTNSTNTSTRSDDISSNNNNNNNYDNSDNNNKDAQSIILALESNRFRMQEPLNSVQRKSYVHENRCMKPSPIVIEAKPSEPGHPLITSGTVTIQLVDGNGQELPGQVKSALVNIDGPTLTVPLDHVNKAHFYGKVVQTSERTQWRLQFTVRYRANNHLVEETFFSNPFVSYSNKGKKRKPGKKREVK